MVRFRNGAPAQRNNSNLSNRVGEPFREPVGPGSSHGQPRPRSSSHAPRPVCGSDAVWAALSWTCSTARRIIGVARRIDRLTRCPGPYRSCISASRRSTGMGSPTGLVVMSQHVRMLASTSGAGSNSELRTSASPRSPASMIAQECARPAGTAWSRRAARREGTGRRRAGAGRWWRGRGRSRCRAATRRLRAARRPRRGRVPGCVPGRRRPGRAPSGGEEAAGGVPGRAVAPMMPACSCGPG